MESRLSSLRLMVDAVWLTVFGVGCVVVSFVVVVVFDRVVRWKGFSNE